MVQRFSLRTAPPLKYKGNRVNAPYGNSLLSLMAQKQNVLNQWGNAGVERVAKQARQYKHKGKANNKSTVKMPYKMNIDTNQYSSKLMSAINDYLTTSNDATLIADNRPKNIHLKDRSIHGAEFHAAWAKDNPALNKFGLTLGAAPFAVMAAPFVLKAAPYLSNSYLLGRVGSTLAGKTGSAVGGAIGNSIDLGLSGAGIYNGVKTLADSNADAFDKTLGVVNGVASSIPLWNTGRMAFRSSFADNVFPVTYTGTAGDGYTKEKQALKTFKDTFKKVITLKANQPVSKQPYWKKYAMDEYLDSRQDAVNLAMRQPVYNNIYIKNADGTYSYNPDKVAPIYGPTLNKLKTLKDGDRIGMYDFLTSNGGKVTVYKENGKLYMYDVWDLQPFKEDIYPFGKFGKFMHKYLPNFEIVKTAGGKPFVLNHEIKID